MQSGVSGVDGLPGHSSVDANNNHVDPEEPHPLQRVIEGEEVFVKIDPKSILQYTMMCLGAAEPMLESSLSDDVSYKVSINLDVSHLNSGIGNSTTVLGEPSYNYNLAETSAVMSAFKFLQQNNLVSIVDFSTRLAQRYDAYNINGLLVDAISSLQHLVSQFGITLGHCHAFAVKLNEMQLCNSPAGSLSAKGKVYAILGDPFTDLVAGLDTKLKNLKSEMKDVEFLHSEYQKKKAAKADMAMIMAPLHRIIMPNKDILDYVLSFFGIDEAEYTSCPSPHAMAETSLLLKFPFMDNHQFSGPISLFGNGATSKESAENAAFKALVFIEKNFGVKVGDFNYDHRKKALKHMNKLFGLLSVISELASKVRFMWFNLNHGIEFHVVNFGLDPSNLFTGDYSEGQIEAFRFCSDGLADVNKFSLNGFDSCGEHILSLKKLPWKILDVKSNLAI